MRTTVDLDDDLLLALKELARLRGETLGKALSDTVRSGLMSPTHLPPVSGSVVKEGISQDVLSRFGFEPLPFRGKLVTNELIDQIRDDEGL